MRTTIHSNPATAPRCCCDAVVCSTLAVCKSIFFVSGLVNDYLAVSARFISYTFDLVYSREIRPHIFRGPDSRLRLEGTCETFFLFYRKTAARRGSVRFVLRLAVPKKFSAVFSVSKTSCDAGRSRKRVPVGV